MVVLIHFIYSLNIYVILRLNDMIASDDCFVLFSPLLICNIMTAEKNATIDVKLAASHVSWRRLRRDDSFVPKTSGGLQELCAANFAERFVFVEQKNHIIFYLDEVFSPSNYHHLDCKKT